MGVCAFLTTDDLRDFVVDDELAVPAFAELGWEVEAVPWRAAADWSRFAAVVIRSTWDYQYDPGAFLGVLEEIGASGARLANPLPLVRWNLDKRYLRELADRGAPVVPTRYREAPDSIGLAALFDQLETDEMVVKPVVGANAGDTFRLRREEPRRRLEGVARVYRGRILMAQPFMESVVGEGEHSLHFFAGELSHAVLKVPGAGDFRVQEEHGGEILARVPEDDLAATAREILALLGSVPLYARVDLVRAPDGSSQLMELELIEPALYLRTDPAAPGRFARAFAAWMESADG